MTICRNCVHCTVHYTLYTVQYYFFASFFSRNLTTVLVLIEEPLLYLQPCCLANSPSRVPGQDSNPGPFGRQACCYQPTNDDLCFGFFLMLFCLICKEAGACSSHLSSNPLTSLAVNFFCQPFLLFLSFHLAQRDTLRK
jgi:hypothetical protein